MNRGCQAPVSTRALATQPGERPHPLVSRPSFCHKGGVGAGAVTAGVRMDWGASPAIRALRQAGAVAAVARRIGCGPDEAAGMLAEHAAAAADERDGVSRRA